MTRIVLPAPDGPDPRHAAQAAPVTGHEQALRGFLVGRHPRVADTGPGRVGRSEPAEDAPADGHERLLYLPAITCCFAIVQYDAASARLVRRITGLFGDADCAETYARASGYHLYDVVPATAVMPTLP
jgi:hypothetical protein